MLRLAPLTHARPRALLAGLLLCALVLQMLGSLPLHGTLASGDAVAAARCADGNADAPSPAPSPPNHCKLCGIGQPFFFVVALFVSRLVAPERVEFLVPEPPGDLARLGWGSSWSSQAPPAG